ncbi:MAG TPA: hypothetical protein HA306_06995 [Methanosarcina sp.]|nr:hypothetical protein [Methanosarcina sp.]
MYTRAHAIEIMQMTVKGDKTYTMFDALVAAKLDVAAKCPSCQIKTTIADADQWMDKYSSTGVKASSAAWQDSTYFAKCSIPSGKDLYKKLDAYNNGLL